MKESVSQSGSLPGSVCLAASQPTNLSVSESVPPRVGGDGVVVVVVLLLLPTASPSVSQAVPSRMVVMVR